MKKKERVIAAIEGKEVDCVPCGFSLHFPKDIKSTDEMVQEHLRFFESTDVDIAKIMNENLVRAEFPISTGADLKKIAKISMKAEYMKEQIEISKKILKKCPKDLFTVGTLHGICASSIHPLEGQGMEYHIARKFILDAWRKSPDEMAMYFENITNAMCDLAKAYLEVGVDGIYYAALGGETDLLTDDEFEEWFRPYDLRILNTIKEYGGYTFLHICKDHLNMQRYKDYVPLSDVINWGVYEAPFSLEDGRKLFTGCTVMGGLPNRSGVMTEGTDKELIGETKKIIQSFGNHKFILGADCTLPTEIPYSRIRLIADVAHSL